ncbi:hypothetical protein Rumeso_04584 [Rubellimicrobium mesophilum DSM 19309]|uniref:EAL domain-containing protein n=1 Tax=Rubellimicrobium mesophilum DSM 19309 TaxID=442562 RepID=A0A017HJ81_9RHOB|nr:EAL domain-containing protein [Rubellimicrobium mesophilum]EYD73849.1 hypothetical protein Rumeso_04584 [Rubellimicrobium mesophilum DSM 19309]
MIDSLKIDRSFIARVDELPHKGKIVAGVLALADSLGLQVTAEGIERDEELDFLTERKLRAGAGLPAWAAAAGRGDRSAPGRGGGAGGEGRAASRDGLKVEAGRPGDGPARETRCGAARGRRCQGEEGWRRVRRRGVARVA